jgi:hypothetical protein
MLSKPVVAGNAEKFSQEQRGPSHIVVAAVLGLRLSRHGIHLDQEGRGMSYYEFRKPAGWAQAGSEINIKSTIVATFAGLLAQKKFHPRCSTNGARDDENLVDLLLKEAYPNDLIGLDSLAWSKLQQESVELVDTHWAAIEAIAKALWSKKLTPRQVEPEPMRSHLKDERRLEGSEIVSILAEFEIAARLRDDGLPRLAD